MSNVTQSSGYAASEIGIQSPVSVIMPVRNEERHLAEAVSHVLRQDYPGPLELVLAVGPSADATLQIARRLAVADRRITVLANPSGLIPAANNAAIKASRYPIIARVDGHALIPPGYLRTAVQVLHDTGADNVGGVMAAAGVTPFEQAVAWAMTSRAGVGAARFHTGGRCGPVESVYLGVYRRGALERAGGYDETFERAEDWELNHRIRQAGGLIWFDPRLRVTYRPRGTVTALASQYFNYGRWRRVVCRQHARTVNLRYLAPPLAVLAMTAGLATGIAGLAASTAAPALAWLALGFAVPGAYLAGLLGVTASAIRSLPPRALARLPVALASMHVFWGIGFLTSPRRLHRGTARREGLVRWVRPSAAPRRCRGRAGR